MVAVNTYVETVWAVFIVSVGQAMCWITTGRHVQVKLRKYLPLLDLQLISDQQKNTFHSFILYRMHPSIACKDFNTYDSVVFVISF